MFAFNRINTRLIIGLFVLWTASLCYTQQLQAQSNQRLKVSRSLAVDLPDFSRGMQITLTSNQRPKKISIYALEVDSRGVVRKRFFIKKPVVKILKKAKTYIVLQLTTTSLEQTRSYKIETRIPSGKTTFIKSRKITLPARPIPPILGEQVVAGGTTRDVAVKLGNDQFSLDLFGCEITQLDPSIKVDSLDSCAPIVTRLSYCTTEAKLQYRFVRRSDGAVYQPQQITVQWFVSNTELYKPRIPETGAYVGVKIDQTKTDIRQLNQKTGFHFGIVGFFADPDYFGDFSWMTPYLEVYRTERVAPLITVTLKNGLAAVKDEDFKEFACYLKTRQLPTFIRFAHEMNGGWFAWGQKPIEYKEVYRRVANIMHAYAPNVSMVWAPNHGAGYPFSLKVNPGEPNFIEMDTTQDGLIDVRDDPYAPFYPGDEYVDWIGMSGFHMGANGIYFKNIAPNENDWGVMNGRYNIYYNLHSFSLQRNKPMMLAETGAFFEVVPPEQSYATEEEIKIGWMKQIWNLSINKLWQADKELKNIKAYIWFNEIKNEQETTNLVNWSLDSNPNVLEFLEIQ